MRTHVVDHPLVAHKLTVLRDEATDSPTFRRLADELVTLLAYEATREVRVDPVDIVTPVAPTTGVVRLREELPVSVSRDAFVVARAGSDKPLSPVVGDAERFSVLPIALTNPIFLDVDGRGGDRGRQGEDSSFHGAHPGRAPCQLGCHAGTRSGFRR